MDDPRDAPPFHHGAWLLWLAAAMVPALWTRNPIYLALVVFAVGALYLALSRPHSSAGPGSPATTGWVPLLKLGLLLALLTASIPPLLVHTGETTLFTLPALALPLPGLPESVEAPRLGGPVTLESVAYGVSTALGLMALLLGFATFNLATDAYALLRALPRGLSRSGVVLSIAVTFVPQMMEAQREIREAQALRGHRFRGLRDLGPLFVVLLAEGLERSITLAESLEARGFSASRSPRTGRAPRHTRLRRASWRRRDSAFAATAGASLLLVLTAYLTGPSGLGWYPYPRVAWPTIHPLVLAALALLAAPLVPLLRTRLRIRLRTRRGADETPADRRSEP